MVKREEPDFEVILSSGEVMLIEITRATTMKNEALKHQLSQADEDIEMAEVSNDMFTLEKPNKGEMLKKPCKIKEMVYREPECMGGMLKNNGYLSSYLP
ncbi:MAG: hypothetical protein LRZ88_09340 [Candidatus Cloacimonetes bacterium]|nr:hypothetical protein [Candidatus Cloacimonadota bacterium]